MSFNYTKPSEVATGGLVYKGTFNASTGSPDLSNAEQGDLYVISVGGTIYGQTWSVGDHLLINADMGGSITNSKIDKVDNTDAVTSVNGLVGTVVLSGDDIAADHTASNYTPTNANIDGHLAGIDSQIGASAPVDSVNGQTGVVNIYADDSTLNLAGNGLTISGTGATSTLNADVTSVNGATGAVSLGINNLSDVDTSGITNTQLLAYNSTSGNFEPTSPTSVPDATDSVKGIIEIATNAEATTGTATDKALVPSNISSFSIASSQVTGLATVATSGAYADLSGKPTTATTTSEGIIELATNAEATTGTATDKALTPSNVSSLSIASSQVTGLATVATSGAYADLTGTPTTATTTSEGIIELATNAEATAGTATDKALVPSNISSISIGQLSDIDLSGISNTELLAYNSTSGNFEPTSPTSVPDATDSVKGIIEISTNAEATTGTATDKALVPSNISSFSIASSQVTGLATVATSGAYADLSGKLTTATTTSEGILETATDAETTTGTANDKALTPSNIDAISAGQLSDINLSGVAVNDFLKYSGSVFEPTTDGTALTIEVVSDTSPQLGGDLDLNGNDFVSVSNGDIDFTPNGTGKVVFKGVTGNGGNGAGRFQLNCEQNSHGIIIQGPPHSAAANYTLTLPDDTGAANTLLQSDGSGNLSWTGPHLLAASNLSDLADATTARTNLSAQAQDAGLDSIAALTTAADKMIYTTGADTYAVTDLTAAGRAILDDATAADQRTTLGLVAVASSGNASDVTSAVNPTHYTKASNDVDGHLSGIDTAFGLISPPSYQSITNASSPVTGVINKHYSADTSGGAITINLPAISGATTAQRIYIKLKTAGNNLTLTPNGSDTIDKGASYIMSVEHSALTLVVGDGSNWEII